MDKCALSKVMLDGGTHSLSPVVVSGGTARGVYQAGCSDLASKLSKYRGSRICEAGSNQDHTFRSPFVVKSNPTLTPFILFFNRLGSVGGSPFTKYKYTFISNILSSMCTSIICRCVFYFAQPIFSTSA